MWPRLASNSLCSREWLPTSDSPSAPPRCCDYRCAPSSWVLCGPGDGDQDFSILDRLSANWVTSPTLGIYSYRIWVPRNNNTYLIKPLRKIQEQFFTPHWPILSAQESWGLHPPTPLPHLTHTYNPSADFTRESRGNTAWWLAISSKFALPVSNLKRFHLNGDLLTI